MTKQSSKILFNVCLMLIFCVSLMTSPSATSASGVSSFKLQIAPSGIPEAQVRINSITDNTVPSITANITITNESTLDYEYLYEWCVVSSDDNECGGGDDVFAASATKFIQADEDYNTNLNATVPNPGNYWFKLLVYWDGEESGSYITFTAGQEGGGSNGGNGGGGSPSPPPVAKVIFQGIAYPSAVITILKDGGKTKTTKADSKADFKAEVTNVTAGDYIFGIWAKDTEERKSITLSYSVKVQAGGTKTVSNIFFPPTISLEKTSIKKGEILEISGQSVSGGKISLLITPGDIIRETTCQKDGKWKHSFDPGILEEGIYNIKTKIKFGKKESGFSQFLSFGIGEVVPGKEIYSKADFSGDDKVNLVDFSIFLCWWRKTNSQIDLNNNGIVDLADFSIFLCCWTG